MKKPFVAILVGLAVLAAVQPEPAAQLRVQPIANQQGKVALGLALRKLQSVGTLMMTTAHPDDENNAMLAQVGLGEGWRTTLVTATRGDGGQNEIGPELFDALAVLRTEELARGAPLRRRRAVLHARRGLRLLVQHRRDIPEVGPARRSSATSCGCIRTIRPDVIVGFVWEGRGGGQHHQASTRLTAEAFRAAADPARFPEQIKEGLRPWQAKKFYYTAGFFGPPGRLPRPAPKPLAVDTQRLRPAARAHLHRDRSRGAQHAQVPGHGAGAAAARRWPNRDATRCTTRRSTGGPDAARRLGDRRDRAHPREPRTLRGVDTTGRADDRARRPDVADRVSRSGDGTARDQRRP